MGNFLVRLRLGLVTAAEILLIANEFRTRTAAKHHVDVVPFERSFDQRRDRVSLQANKRVREILYLAAFPAVRYYANLRAFYERKEAEVKDKMLLINNLCHRLDHCVFVCIRQNCNHDKNYAATLV